MLNFLLDRSPTSTKQKTRQTTLDNMFSHLTARSPLKKSSSPPSLTTGSSVTDHSSEASDDLIPSSALSRTSVSITDTSTASFTKLQKNTIIMGQGVSKQEVDIHGEGAHGSVEREMNTSLNINIESATVQAAPSSLSSDATPPSSPEVDSAHTTPKFSSSRSTPEHSTNKILPEPPTTPRTSPRKKSVQDAKSITPVTTKKILGKRQRGTNGELQDSQTESPKSRKSPRRSVRSVRSIVEKADTQERHHVVQSNTKSAPKAKSDNAAASKTSIPSKTYTDKGYFAGQVMEMNGRLTAKQNEARKQAAAQERKYLPLPMYNARRLIKNGRDFKLPFDLFSPLDSRQPQPEKWGKLKKNVYGDDTEKAKKVHKHQEESYCVCINEDGCGDGCLNRTLHVECDKSNCKPGAAFCKNRSFADLKARNVNAASSGKALATYLTGVEVCKTPGRGFGLRASRSFDENQIVIEYTGEIITKEEASRRLSSKYKDHTHHYMMEFHGGLILDGTRGSFARFVNHSCSPNCRIEKRTVGGMIRMALFAERDILPGEEMTYDYNFEPFNKESKQVCHCGSANCRGFLVSKPKETKEIKDALQPITGQKRKLGDAFAAIAEKVMPASKRQKAIPRSAKAKAKAAAEAAAASQKGKSAGKKPYKLPKGWVPGDKPRVNVNDTDPEAIGRAARKRAKEQMAKEKQAQLDLANRDVDVQMEDANTTLGSGIEATETASTTTTMTITAKAKRIANSVKNAARSAAGKGQT